jgi:hypothetical protein
MAHPQQGIERFPVVNGGEQPGRGVLPRLLAQIPGRCLRGLGNLFVEDGATFAERNYSSVNHSGAEFWTDGRTFAPLVPKDDGVRRCVCGCHHLIRNADQIAVLTTDSIISPPQAAQRVDDADTGALLTSGITDKELLIVLRRRRWLHLNNPYRVVCRQHRETDQGTFPTCEPTKAQPDNMSELLGLLATERAAS